jgi:glycosyltransferase involved in cell wall biosynthesis/ribosomal protein S18 acetylase RimI-like enzyme
MNPSPQQTDDWKYKVAHLTTIDLSLRYLVFPQLLAIRDLQAEAIGISAPGPHVKEIEAAGIRHIPLRSSTRGMDLVADVRASRELWRILRREHIDVLHTHNPKPGIYGRILGRLAGVPIVVNTVHGLYATPDDPWPKRALVYFLEALASRFSDVELVQSREDYDLLTRWRISPPRRTWLLGNGVDLDRFNSYRFSPRDRELTRKAVGAVTETVVVGIVGRLVAEKGYPELFEAAGQLDDRFLFVCIGPDDPSKSDALPRGMVEAAESAGVRFLGMRTDIDVLYNAMDLFVLPSHREGFPRAAMEAAAMGLPVIATNIRGCREVVSHNENGLLIPVGDVGALVEAIELLGADRDLRERMGEQSARRARQSFDESRVVATVMKAYSDAGRRRGLELVVLDEDLSIRRARLEDVARIARLHERGITTGFLPRLGHRFLTVLYRALIKWRGATVLVAGSPMPMGFVAGVDDTRAFNRYFIKRWGLVAALAALPRLLLPSVMRRAWQTLRYPGADEATAELLSMVVDSRVRRRRLGAALGRELLATMSEASVSSIRVVLGGSNGAAKALYRSLGFVPEGTIEVHPGETSLEMVWSAPG